MVSSVVPTLVKALAGGNVTLPVSFSVARNTVVTWFKGSLTLGTWTINSSSPPDIASKHRDVLGIESNGSLTFKDVPQNYSGNYTVELTKSGELKLTKTFVLKIYGKLNECEM